VTRRSSRRRSNVLVPSAEPPIELPARPAGPIDRIIADHIARLIPDRATIELGLGAIPEAVTRALGSKRGLGVHSEAVGDGIADLMAARIVDNRHKEIDADPEPSSLIRLISGTCIIDREIQKT
jgi:acyl-CoA hydrolase